MMRSAAYNRFGVLMGTSSRASCPRWLSLRGDSLLMITLISSQGDFCATALKLPVRMAFTHNFIGVVLCHILIGQTSTAHCSSDKTAVQEGTCDSTPLALSHGATIASRLLALLTGIAVPVLE